MNHFKAIEKPEESTKNNELGEKNIVDVERETIKEIGDTWKELPSEYLNHHYECSYSSVGEASKAIFEKTFWNVNEKKNLEKKLEETLESYKEVPKAIGVIVSSLEEIAGSDGDKSRHKDIIIKSLEFFRNESARNLIIESEKNLYGNELTLISRLVELPCHHKEEIFKRLLNTISSYKKAPFFANFIAREVTYTQGDPQKILDFFDKQEIRQELLNQYKKERTFLVGLRRLVLQSTNEPNEKEFYDYISKEKRDILAKFDVLGASSDTLGRIKNMEDIMHGNVFRYFSQVNPDFALLSKKVEVKLLETITELKQVSKEKIIKDVFRVDSISNKNKKRIMEVFNSYHPRDPQNPSVDLNKIDLEKRKRWQLEIWEIIPPRKNNLREIWGKVIKAFMSDGEE